MTGDHTDDELDQDHEQRDGFSTFDDYLANRPRTREVVATVILGEEVELPESLPIGFELRAHRLNTVDDEAEQERHMRELVAMLYGDDALDEWADQIDVEALQVLIIWGAANVREPWSMTFEEAAEAAQAAEGKARKLATRRPAPPQRKRPKRSSSKR